MHNPPTGTVTFLFTEIEGSTKLAQEFPDTLPLALEKHHSILKNTIELNGGFIFEINGDDFCSAFENAYNAVEAAYHTQIKLNSEKWDDAQIKVRMGIHTGIAEWNLIRYMGYMTLARTNRVMSIAYGGQILISNVAFELAKEKVQNEFSYLDLGEKQLKDLIQPIHIYQITSSEFPSDFPPLKTMDARTNNLPIQLTSFVGREEEMNHVKDLLKRTHLLTITGSGGSGKTRLALQVAADIIDDFANGVWFVELAALLDPVLLPQEIIKVFGVKEEPKKTLEEALCDYLRDKEILLILDNCEQLIDACAKLIEKLLINCTKLKIIATSREALRCRGEQTHRVQSLEIPNPDEKIPPEELTEYEAVILFIVRALAINPNFSVGNENAPALAQICFQLDGIPLAIELAAARIKVLSIEKIYERLNNRFKLLTEGKRTALPRQQTLRATIDWSYDLLSESEKILWRRLSVFAGGWTLEAAEKICSDKLLLKAEILDLLSNLSEKSIIIFENEKERYRMLETIRQYGQEKHQEEEKESEIIRTKHLEYFMKYAETAEPKLTGGDQVEWLERLELEYGNFQAALTWSSNKENQADGLQLAGALGRFWIIHGHFYVGRRWMQRLLEANPLVSKFVRAKALQWGGSLAHHQGDYEMALKLHEESLILSRELGGKLGIANSLNGLGNVMTLQCEYKRAKQFYAESLALYRELEDKYTIAISLTNLGSVELEQGNYGRARKLLEESLIISREIGDKYGMARSLNKLGNVAFFQGMYEDVQQFYEESLVIRREIGDKNGISISLTNLGNLAFNQGKYELAREFSEESLAIKKAIGDKCGIAIAMTNLGNVAFQQKQYGVARELFEESLEIFQKVNDKYYISSTMNDLGNLEFIQKDYLKAREFFEKSLALNQETENKKQIVNNILGFSRIQSIEGNDKRAVKLLGSIEELLKSMKAVLDSQELNLYVKTIAELKEKLGEEKFANCWAEGKALILEKATELALRRDGDE